MRKIAVCISGLVRYWEETYPLFEHWNNLYDDVEFVFFLATWKGDDVWYEEERFGKIEIVDIDYSKYDFLEDYVKLDPIDVDFNLRSSKPNINYMSYAIKEVQKLRRNSKHKFDGVIQTRNDALIHNSNILDTCVNLVRNKQYFYNDDTFFTSESLSIQKEFIRENPYRLILQQDNFYFGTPIAMDKFSKMYDMTFIDGDISSRSCHFTPAEHIYKQGLTSIKIRGFPLLLRDGKMIKQGRPTPEIMRYLIQEKGVEWIYNQPLDKLMNEYFTYE